MINMLTIMTVAQQTSVIIGFDILLMSALFAYVAQREYRMYLEDNYKVRFSIRDFIRKEQSYIYLWLAFVGLAVGVQLLCLMEKGVM